MKHMHLARTRAIIAVLAALSGNLAAQDAGRLILGLGGMRTPEYTGSDRYRWGVCPFVKADWARGRTRLYAEGTEAGIRRVGIGLERLSLYGGVATGESRDDVSNPLRAFFGLTYGNESLSVSTRLVYAPFLEDGDFGGHGLFPELYLTARAVRLPVVLSGSFGVAAMNGAWADSHYDADAGLLGARLDGNALLYFCRSAGFFLGGGVTRYLGEAATSRNTDAEWAASFRTGAFIMIGGAK